MGEPTTLGYVKMSSRKEEKGQGEIRFNARSTTHCQLSNQHLAPFTMDTVEWPTVQHYCSAMKFTDVDYKEAIRTVVSPLDAQRMAKSKKYSPNNDTAEQLTIMNKALLAKFTQHPALRALLVDSHPATLVHAVGDPYWGCGCDLEGQNTLGLLLMSLRSQFLSKK